MKILIYGAGIIGSIYAAKLYKEMGNTTLLARGKRYDDLKTNGIIIKNVVTNQMIKVDVPLTQKLESFDLYDLIIITVRSEQVNAIIPAIKNNRLSPLLLFMINDPGNLDKLIVELQPKQVVIGFPGIGGAKGLDCIEFIHIKQQNTTIGEYRGELTPEIKIIKFLFKKSGFPVSINRNMFAWLKTHSIFVSCISAAIDKEKGDSVRLGKNIRSVKIMVQSIREGFKALESLGVPVQPKNLKIIFMKVPLFLCIIYWKYALRSKMGTFAISPHANSAKDEMQFLAGNVLLLLHTSAVNTPVLDELLTSYIGKSVRTN